MGIKLTSNNNNLDLTTKIQTVVIEGGYYTPSVDEEGNLSWIPSREGLEPIEEVNIKGEKGEQGIQGIQGERGIQGLPGKDGVDGAPGKDGKDGVNGKDGAPGAKGEKGDTGAQGEKGESGVYVGTTEPTDDEMLVWINPEGGESAELATTDYVDAAIKAALEEVENGTY